MNNKPKFGMRNKIPRLKTHYRETEWEERLDGDNGVSNTRTVSANGEVSTTNPARETSNSSFDNQFRQRKLKRKLEVEVSKSRCLTIFRELK